jgi:glutamate synthase (NADPH/NADH) small chain
MGKVTGFLEYPRESAGELPVETRISNYNEFLVQLPSPKLSEQGARCMDCGVPFCQAGCPLGNLIPEWNDLVYREDWERAARRLFETNNFPEFTGRVCPAPCEESCVLAISEPAVTIKNIEHAIVERAFEEGWINYSRPRLLSGKSVAIVGSGPAGLACADQLHRAGHSVTVFERADRIGGLLRYGIPDFKLEKSVLDRRLKLMEEAGVVFRAGVNVGVDITPTDLKNTYDAVVLCVGATIPRDLLVPGRELNGVHFAMEFLAQQNRRVANDHTAIPNAGWWFENSRNEILSTNKAVIVIGGGDTGSDCVGVSNRQNAKSVTQFEFRPMPPQSRPAEQPWPKWPVRLRTSSSHREGCEREWSISTVEIIGQNGQVQGVKTREVEWKLSNDGCSEIPTEVPGSERIWPADLVLLALGFQGPELMLIDEFGLERDVSGRITTDKQYQTSVPGVFSCGDMRRGQSLVVWAMSEGREAARGVDKMLMGKTSLRTKGSGDL